MVRTSERKVPWGDDVVGRSSDNACHVVIVLMRDDYRAGVRECPFESARTCLAEFSHLSCCHVPQKCFDLFRHRP
jgi:hypothetical protein